MIDGRNFFDQSVKDNLITFDKIRKIATGQGDDYTSRLLDYPYFKNCYKMIATNLNKQQAVDADPKANQFYCKSRSRWKHKNVFQYCGNQRNHFRFFTRNCKIILNVFHNFCYFVLI